MKHRHLSGDDPAEPGGLGLAALDDILDRGDLVDWAPVAAVVAADPWGPVAEAVLGLVDAHPMYGTSPLWRRWVHERRQLHPRPATLAELRRSAGLTQDELATTIDMSQSDLSKLERRGDSRLSTLVRFAEALGGRLHVVIELPGTGERVTLRLGDDGETAPQTSAEPPSQATRSLGPSTVAKRTPRTAEVDEPAPSRTIT